MTIGEGDHRIAELFKARRGDLPWIVQNRFHDEGSFIRFARDRGFAISGVVSGDPSRFVELDLLQYDLDENHEMPGRFHPFRIYQLHAVLELCRLHIAPSSSVNRDRFLPFLEQVVDRMPTLEHISSTAAPARPIVELAILLEPLHWPAITDQTILRGLIELGEYEERLDAHRSLVERLLQDLDVEDWKTRHERVRRDAALMDENGDLYIISDSHRGPNVRA